MNRILPHLILYSDLGPDSILVRLAEIIRECKTGGAKEPLLLRANAEVKRILDLSTACGFDENLWQCYLTWVLMTNENSFTRTCERVGATEGGSVNRFAESDFAVFHQLFHYDFSELERYLLTDCFSILTDYHAIPKRERTYNRDVSAQVLALRKALSEAENGHEMFQLVTDYYKRYGYGVFAMNRAFRIRREDGLEFLPISNVDGVRLEDLLGYESQKAELRRNTEAFLAGKHANNVLLYGDAGTGKSTSVKALINEYYDRGLRMIEIYKHQFGELSRILAEIKNRNYRFIIFIDDLENVLIYATSNRRHLIRETWNDRQDMEHHGDIHRSDTMEEKLSLAARFGVTINYNAPSPKEFQAIVKALAERQGIQMDEKELMVKANAWEVRHGGFSGRTAQQFVHYLEGLAE